MNDLVKNLLLWVVVAVVLMVVFQSFSPKAAATTPLTYDQFVQEVQGDRVSEVTIADDRTTISGKRKDGTAFTTYAPGDKDLVNDLLRHGVTTVQKPPSSGMSLGVILVNVLPWLLFIGIWVYFMRQMQQGGGKGAMSFGRSRAKLLNEDQSAQALARVGCPRSSPRTRGVPRWWRCWRPPMRSRGR